MKREGPESSYSLSLKEGKGGGRENNEPFCSGCGNSPLRRGTRGRGGGFLIPSTWIRRGETSFFPSNQKRSARRPCLREEAPRKKKILLLQKKIEIRFCILREGKLRVLHPPSEGERAKEDRFQSPRKRRWRGKRKRGEVAYPALRKKEAPRARERRGRSVPSASAEREREAPPPRARRDQTPWTPKEDWGTYFFPSGARGKGESTDTTYPLRTCQRGRKSGRE